MGFEKLLNVPTVNIRGRSTISRAVLRLRPGLAAAEVREGDARQLAARRHDLAGTRARRQGGGADREGADPQGTLDLPPELPPRRVVDAEAAGNR